MNQNPEEIQESRGTAGTRGILKKELITLAVLAVLSLSFALVLRLCVAQAYEIRGASMERTYFNHDRVLLLKLAPSLLPVEHGDVIIFSHPAEPGRDLVKRIIGVEGDNIQIAGGEVYRNGTRIRSPHRTTACGRHSWVVPEDCYFVLGDNRANSLDSRHFGFVREELVKGEVWFRWWPVNR